MSDIKNKEIVNMSTQNTQPDEIKKVWLINSDIEGTIKVSLEKRIPLPQTVSIEGEISDRKCEGKCVEKTESNELVVSIEGTIPDGKCEGKCMTDIESNKLEYTVEEIEMEISKKYAAIMKTICNMYSDIIGDITEPHVEDAEFNIPLTNLSVETMIDILEFCKVYEANPPNLGVDDTDDDEEYDPVCKDENFEKYTEFFDSIKDDQPRLFGFLTGVNYLDIKPFLNVSCKTVANMIKGKTPEEIRTLFNIENDFTEEELEQIKKENEWIEERA